MKTQRLFGAVTLGLLLPLASAFADHRPGQPALPNQGDDWLNDQKAQILSTEAQRLDSEVRWTNFNQGIKDNVSRFAAEALQLASCERANPDSGYPPGYGNGGYGNGSWAQPYPSRNCDYQLSETIQSFSLVEHYLRDTYYGYPSIYRQYDRTRLALEEVRYGQRPAPGQPPHQGVIRAVGSLDNLNFNLIGRNRNEVEQKCLDLGYPYRVNYVRGVRVNGQQLGGRPGTYLTLGQACNLVGQYAR